MLRTNTPLSIPRCNRVASPLSFFVNREDEINAIVNILKRNDSSAELEQICAIRGNTGTGKTELCYAAAYRLLQEYPDAQIYLKAQENDSADISLFKILETVIH